jgi:heptosyltransferase-2
MGQFRRPKGSRQLVVMPGTAQKNLLAQAILADLRLQYPSRPLDVMALAGVAGLVSRFPQVDKTLNLPEPNMGWKLYWRSGIEMQGRGYSHAWVLPDRFKPALIPALANIPERTGYRGKYRYSLLIDIRLHRKDLHPHPADRYRALAWDIGEPLPPLSSLGMRVDSEAQQQLLQQHQLTLDKPILAWCPGSLHVPEPGRHRIDPLQHKALLQQALEQGWQVWLFGSRHEQLEINHLLSQLGEPLNKQLLNFTGLLGWEQVVDLLSLAKLQMGQDNPLALLGCACGVPVYLPVADELLEKDQGLAPHMGAEWIQLDQLEQKLGEL